MSRIINHETPGKERKYLLRLIGYSIRELNFQVGISGETRDLAAFIAISLKAIYESIDRSVEPWEKRGYWLKADRFRMEWTWTLQMSNQIRDSVLNEDWAQVARLTASVAEKLGDIKLPKRSSSGKFWIGAMNSLKKS